MISYDGKQISTEQTEKVQTEFTSVALLGAVFCGVPTLEEEYIEEYVSLPASICVVCCRRCGAFLMESDSTTSYMVCSECGAALLCA